MSKEYTYDIDKYTIGVDENGEDGIGMTVAKIENGEIKFLGNCYGENARCLDLLIKENKQLKDNWNKLKEFMSYENIGKLFDMGYDANDFINEIDDKIKELEQGSASNE